MIQLLGLRLDNADFSMDALGTLEIDSPTAPGGRLMITEDGLVGINRMPEQHLLEVNGGAFKTAGTGEWRIHSDKRLKKNITPLDSEEMLSKLLQLQGVQYEWDDQQTGLNRPKGIQYGFTAQNIQEVFPKFVTEDGLGFLQTAYGTYDAMYVECFRALNEKMETLEQETEALETEFGALDELEKILLEQEEKLKTIEQSLTQKNQ